jgi:hypothetical protein
MELHHQTTPPNAVVYSGYCCKCPYTTIVPAFGWPRGRERAEASALTHRLLLCLSRTRHAYQHMKLRFRSKGEASSLYNLREFFAEQTHKQCSAASSSFRWRPGYPRHDTVSTVTTVIDQGPSKSGHVARQATSFVGHPNDADGADAGFVNQIRKAKAEDLL